MAGALEPDPVSTKQQRIAELAKQAPQMGFFSLAHHIDLRWLYQAYLRVRPDGAAGVDGQTAADYAAHLGDNLRSLLERAKSVYAVEVILLLPVACIVVSLNADIFEVIPKLIDGLSVHISRQSFHHIFKFAHRDY